MTHCRKAVGHDGEHDDGALSWEDAEVAPKPGDLDRIRFAHAVLAGMLKAYVEQHGPDHDDPECPEDDTCSCPTTLALSNALDESIAAIEGIENMSAMARRAKR